MNVTTVTTKGQIVIPAGMRRKYGIRKGTRLSIEEEGDALVLRPITADYLDKVAGILKAKGSLSKKLLRERARDRKREGRIG